MECDTDQTEQFHGLRRLYQTHLLVNSSSHSVFAESDDESRTANNWLDYSLTAFIGGRRHRQPVISPDGFANPRDCTKYI